MTRARAIFGGTASLLALAAVCFGLPWALLRWGRMPAMPSGDWWQHLTDSAVSDTTVFAVLTVAAWAVWLIFTTATVVEAVAGLRGVQAPHLALAGPFQRLARDLVVAILMMVSVAQSTVPAAANSSSPGPVPSERQAATSAAVTQPRPTPTAQAVDPAPTPRAATNTTVTPGPATSETTPKVIAVKRGDNPWTLAEAHLGDGMRWRELFELNRGVPQPDGQAWTDPEIIRPGWRLQLTSPSTLQPPPEASMIHVVEAGDTLSGLAERYLGNPASSSELFQLNRDRPQPDGRCLTHPDLVVVGWRLVIPTRPPAADATRPAEEPNDPPAEAAPTPVLAAGETPSTTTTMPASDSTPPLPRTTPPETKGHQPSAQGSEPDGSSIPAVAGIGGAVVLATGLALRLRWLRRRLATRGARHAAPPVGPVEHAALSAADVPLVQWAGQQLALLMHTADRRRLTATPLAVEISDMTGIEILWDAPQHAPPPPGWTAADGGWAWRFAYDPDAALPADELPAALPALVTIGQRDGRQLLVDLEAFGILTVQGPTDRAEEFTRSVAVELACGNDLSDAYVTTVGLDLDDAVAPRHRLTATDTAGAVAQLDSATRAVNAVLQGAHLPDTFRARAGDTTPIEATVVVVHDADPTRLTELAALADTRRGVAVVATVAAPPAMHGAHIEIDPSGTSARFEPLGITFQPVRMPAPTAAAIHASIEALADLPDDLTEPAPPTMLHGTGRSLAIAPLPTDVTNGPAPAAADGNGAGNGHAHLPNPAVDSLGPAGFSLEAGSGPDPVIDSAPPSGPEDPDVNDGLDGHLFAAEPPLSEHAPLMVRVLGVPAIPDRPSIGRRELILAALLACRNGTLAASAVQDALWGSRPVEAKTVWNFVANVRRALGNFGDGSPVMPAADRTRGTLHLDPRVTTDLAVLRDIVARADQLASTDAIATLRHGLALVEGPPFDAPGYDWAHRDQDVSEAAAVIEQTVDRLVELAVAAGHIDLARQAITRGLRGLPGDEHLYRTRMRVESAAGNRAGILAAYDELTVHLADFETEPSPVTTALYHELTRQSQPAPPRLT